LSHTVKWNLTYDQEGLYYVLLHYPTFCI
jgi:hypothetical protein